MTTGPGEIMPIATASRNCRLPSQWYSSTTYVFRNGTITRPLPKTRSPVLKKKAKSLTVMPPPTAPASPAASEGGRMAGGGTDERGATGGGLDRKTKTPKTPATTKIAVSSFCTTAVTAQATAKNTHATESLRRVFLPRFQHAFTIRATTTGATP